MTNYVLVTAVRNEENHIEQTIASILGQTVKPRKWAIVNDGSTDGTERIVAGYLSRHDFIRLINRKTGSPRSFASKVYAVHEGLKSLQETDYDFIGNIDGDVEFGPHYFERLFNEFDKDVRLGIAGGWVCDAQGGKIEPRPGNSEHSVPGSVQMFRRECLDRIGGYLPIQAGGEDCIAEVMARGDGWMVRSFPDLRVVHHGPGRGAGPNQLRASYRSGLEDYYTGHIPLFELFKCLRRVRSRPFFVASVFRYFGYARGFLSREPLIVPKDTVEYYRKEQRRRIQSMFKNGRDDAKARSAAIFPRRR